MRTLIAVVSCAPYLARREAVRQTWASVQLPDDVDLCFFIGQVPDFDGAKEAGVITLPCPDDYPSLPAKTYRFVKFARAAGYYRLIKVDDDTYLRLPNALSVLDKGACVGHLRLNPVHTGGMDYPQGGCYSLSSAAMDAVISIPEIFQKPGLEDAAVGRSLAYHGIPLTHSDLITVDYRHGYPSPDNSIVAAHHVSPEVMHTIHKQMKGNPCSKV
jgi:hypothetical protein